MKEVEEAKILVVDSNSKDGTAKIAAGFGAKVINHPLRGKGRAVARGLRYVESNTKWLVIIDGDYSQPAIYIPKMINTLNEKPEIGMVVGLPDVPWVKSYTFWKRVKWVYLNPYNIFHRTLIILHAILNRVNIQTPLAGQRVIRYKLIKDFQPKSKGFDLEIEINCYVRKKGYKILEFPIMERDRIGKAKFSRFKHCFVILRRMVIEALS